jgi:hypothetical protein
MIGQRDRRVRWASLLLIVFAFTLLPAAEGDPSAGKAAHRNTAARVTATSATTSAVDARSGVLRGYDIRGMSLRSRAPAASWSCIATTGSTGATPRPPTTAPSTCPMWV